MTESSSNANTSSNSDNNSQIAAENSVKRQSESPMKLVSRKIIVREKSPVKISYEELTQLFEENEDIFQRVCEDRNKRKLQLENSNSNL